MQISEQPETHILLILGRPNEGKNVHEEKERLMNTRDGVSDGGSLISKPDIKRIQFLCVLNSSNEIIILHNQYFTLKWRR